MHVYVRKLAHEFMLVSLGSVVRLTRAPVPLYVTALYAVSCQVIDEAQGRADRFIDRTVQLINVISMAPYLTGAAAVRAIRRQST